MQLYSTKNRDLQVDLKEAIFRGLPEDNGLYMPLEIPRLPADFLAGLRSFSFQEIAFSVSEALLQGAIPVADLRRIIEQSVDFPAPVIHPCPKRNARDQADEYAHDQNACFAAAFH